MGVLWVNALFHRRVNPCSILDLNWLNFGNLRSIHLRVHRKRSQINSGHTATPIKPTTSSNLQVAHWNTHSVSNKALLINDYIQSKNIDIMMLTETWLGHEDQVIINEITPPHYTFFNVPRPADRHGGIAIVCKEQLNLRLAPITFDVSTFEYSVISDLKQCIYYVTIYRPPPSTSVI